jgi:ribosomal protein S18 acetylase RimI-like enzyme
MSDVFEVKDEAELRTATGDDAVVMWAAQGFADGIRAWPAGAAVAVASPELSGRDRIAVHGPVQQVAPLLAAVLAEVGPTFRPFGDAELIAALNERLDVLEPVGRFGWMDRTGTPQKDGTGPAYWLSAGELPEAALLIDRHFPGSHAHPTRTGARAWAGVRDDEDRLVATAPDAWSAPTVGFLAGVVTDPQHGRGRGHGAAVCSLVLDELLRRCGRAALMVDDWNAPAIRLYRRLDLRWRDLAAARQR